jgi:hypothetical protein
MPRRKCSLQQLWAEGERKGRQHISQTIFEELRLYAVDKQFYPGQNALYGLMTSPQWDLTTSDWIPAQYPDLSKGIYYYWLRRLCESGYVFIDDDSGAMRCAQLEIVEKEVVEPEIVKDTPPRFSKWGT